MPWTIGKTHLPWNKVAPILSFLPSDESYDQATSTSFRWWSWFDENMSFLPSDDQNLASSLWRLASVWISCWWKGSFMSSGVRMAKSSNQSQNVSNCDPVLMQWIYPVEPWREHGPCFSEQSIPSTTIRIASVNVGIPVCDWILHRECSRLRLKLRGG